VSRFTADLCARLPEAPAPYPAEVRRITPDVTALRTNDDSGRGYNARIRMRLPASGTYYVFAGSSGSGADYGQYAVSVNRDTRGC
jgi:hypothetical protein